MKGKTQKYNLLQFCSVIFMVMALLWLTISAPFVYASQQEVAKMEKSKSTGSPLTGTEEESTNPFSNTTEEKTPPSSSFSEEYLHDHHEAEHFFSFISTTYKYENTGTYNAFHGELLVPPPNQA